MAGRGISVRETEDVATAAAAASPISRLIEFVFKRVNDPDRSESTSSVLSAVNNDVRCDS